jgi:hypothetical protein
MERSWGIVLVLLLISITSYAQLSPGTIANNRFLQRVNPAINRALADSGSSLDHPEIQRLARQMVDLGIWGNLVFWVHEGLVKERVSGSDVFVNKLYDISGNTRDAIQTSTTSQPKLISGEIVWDNVNDNLPISFSYSNGTISYCFYINANSADGFFNKRIMERSSDRIWNRTVIADSMQIEYAHAFTSGNRSARTGNIKFNQWVHFVVTYNAGSTANNPIIYINGVDISATIAGTPTGTRLTTTSTNIGNRAANDRPYDGKLSDFRMFNKILTASEVDAIFQETRLKYGL